MRRTSSCGGSSSVDRTRLVVRALVPLAVGVAVVLAAPASRGAVFDTTLDNGLRVVMIEHRASPMISSAVIVGAGVLHEPSGAHGASHLLEHLLFNGTENRTQKELYDEIDFYGAYNNATTREDHTLFTLLIQREFVGSGLDIQADMLFRSTLPEEKFDKEKSIVLEELARDRGRPDYRASTAFRTFAWDGTPISRTVLGTRESIESIDRDTVLAYYRSHYVPGNMTLVLLGDFEIDAMRPVVDRIFGSVPGSADGAPPPAMPPAAWPPVPDRNAKTLPLDAGRVYLKAGAPMPVDPYSREAVAIELLLEALTADADAPLTRHMTTDDGEGVLSFGLTLVPRAAGWSTLEFDATLGSGERIPRALDDVARALAGAGPGSEARTLVDRVRDRLRAEEIRLADRIHYVALMRSAQFHRPPVGYAEDRIDRFDAVTPSDLDRAAVRLREAVGKLRIVACGPGFDDAVQAWAPPELPEPSARTGRGERVVERTLDNGMKLAVERNDDTRVFALHVAFAPRTAAEPVGREGVTALVHRLFTRGTATRTAAELAAELDALGAELKTHDDPAIPHDDHYTRFDHSFVRLELPAEGWRRAVALLAEIVETPRFDETEVGTVRAELLDVARRVGEASRDIAERELWSLLAPGHPGARPVIGTEATVGAMTIEDARSRHAAMVVGRRMIVTAAGPVSPRSVLDALESELGDVPPGEPPPDPVAIPESGESERVEVEGDREQAYLIAARFTALAPEDGPALAVAGALLSDRLAFEVRERQGLAYSIGGRFTPYGRRVLFRVALGTRPENVETALDGVRAVLEDARSDTFEADEVVRAARSLRGRLVMRRMTLINQAYFLGVDLLTGERAGAGLDRLDAFLEVDAEDVARVLRRYLAPDALSVVVVR